MKEMSNFSNGVQQCNEFFSGSLILHLDELANIFKVELRTIQSWVKQGLIPTFKTGGRRCMTLQMLHNFILEKGGIL